MSSEHVYPLDSEALNLFASKGKEGGPGIKQVGNANGVKVRRMIQLTRDLAKRSFKELRILDLACGEGVYAIEAALRGAEVIALDARTERMNEGAQAAERLGLKRLRFEQNDVRKVNLDSHGEFDVIYFLGILYHLDARDIFPVLKSLYEMCRQFVVIDTHISLHGQHQVEQNGHLYKGIQMREHSEDDPESVRKSRLLFSLDNTMSFHFTKESLFRVLNDTGFSSVFECNIPREPYKPENRITVVAMKADPIKVSCYPWVNDKTEDEIEAFLGDLEQSAQDHNDKRLSLTQLVKSLINSVMRSFGFEIKRIEN